MTALVDRTRRQIAGHAEDGLDWPDFGEAVIEVLSAAVPHEAICLAMVDPDSALFTRVAQQGLDLSNLELFMQIELTSPDPLTLTTLAVEPTGVGILADHHGGDPRSNPRCRELLGPIDLEHELRGVVRVGGRMRAAAALYRSPSSRGFTHDEADLLSSLEDVLGHGVRRYFGSAAGAAGAADRDAGSAVLLVDERGHVDHATAAGEIRLGQLAHDASGGLPTAIRTTVAAARAAATGHGALPSVRTCLTTGEWVVVRATVFQEVGPGSHVAVTVEPAGGDTLLELAIEGHGLTPREADVARGVVAGASTADLAATLGISAHTVQDHLKAVFGKTGVSSRRQLAALLCGRPPIGIVGGAPNPFA